MAEGGRAGPGPRSQGEPEGALFWDRERGKQGDGRRKGRGGQGRGGSLSTLKFLARGLIWAGRLAPLG